MLFKVPHLRLRHIEPLLKKSLRFSPITGILGHRQVGKTTLAQNLAEVYTTLDSPSELALAQVNGTAFLAQHEGQPLVIDECQLAPPLFPALKEWVRTRKKPGQFLLTGSVRFSSRKAIRESLTGRIITWELLPMDWAEQHSQPLCTALPKLIKNLKYPLTINTTFNHKAYKKSLSVGGLPGVFGVRDASIRSQRFETQINTILERDLRLLIQTSLSYSKLRKLLQSLALQFGQPLNISQVARETRISMPTLRKLIPALESLFLIRLVPCQGDFSKPHVFFEDIGELQHLLNLPEDSPNLFVAFLYHHLRTQLHYQPELKSEIFSFKNLRGDTAPICFKTGSEVLGIVPVLDGLDEALQNAEATQKQFPNAKILLLERDHDVDQMINDSVRRIFVGRLL